MLADVSKQAGMPAASATTTLYLRGVPRAVVREAKAAAAREGVTLARWVIARIAGGGGPAAPEPESPGDLTRDFAFYEARRSELERKYPGEYVAIIDGAVEDHDPSFAAIAARVFRKHGVKPVCMPLVGRTAVRVRSPRRSSG
jgi:hypothetical protein